MRKQLACLCVLIILKGLSSAFAAETPVAVFEAEKLCFLTGKEVNDPDASGGKARRAYEFDGDKANTLCYGPYRPLPPGKYTAIFRLKVSDNKSLERLAWLRVDQFFPERKKQKSEKPAQETIAEKKITAAAFPAAAKYHDFALPFEVKNAKGQMCYLVYWYGNGDISIDSIRIYKGNYEVSQSSFYERINTWLQNDNDRIVIIGNSIFSPSCLNGKSSFKDGKAKLEFLKKLGVWKCPKLTKRKVLEIRSGSDDFEFEKMNVSVPALLPASSPGIYLPDNAKVLVRGRTEEGEDVPLVFEFEKGKGLIFHIAFAVETSLQLENKLSFALLKYIKKKVLLKPTVLCKGHTGFPTWEGKAWTGKGADKLKMALAWQSADTPDNPENDLSEKLFWTSLLKNCKPSFWSEGLCNEVLCPVSFELCGENGISEITLPHSIASANLDASLLEASHVFILKRRIMASSDTVTQWKMKTLDGRPLLYTDAILFSSRFATRFFFLRPAFWAEKNMVKAYRIQNDGKLKECPVNVDGNIVSLQSNGGNYLIFCAGIQSDSISDFWEKFRSYESGRAFVSEYIPEDLDKYLNVFNLSWIQI